MAKIYKLTEPPKNTKAGLEVPKIAAKDLEYWDSFPLNTKEEFQAAYDDLQDINHHNGCAYLTAKFAKEKKIMQIILYISAIHAVFGSLPYELDKLRFELTNPLYKKILGREEKSVK